MIFRKIHVKFKFLHFQYLFLLLLPNYHKLIEVLLLVKIFPIKLSPDLYVLKKWFLEIGQWVCMCPIVYACDCGGGGEYLEFYISETNEDRNAEIYAQYQKIYRQHFQLLTRKKKKVRLEEPEA